MDTETVVLLVLWILIVLDSTASVLCKFSDECVKFAKKFSIFAKFSLKDSNWPYAYLFLAVLGLVTVLIMNKKLDEKKDKL